MYPRWWRERYGEETCVLSQSLVADGKSELGVAVNLGIAGLRTRLQRRPGVYQMPALATAETYGARSIWVALLAVSLLFVNFTPDSLSFELRRGGVSAMTVVAFLIAASLVAAAVATCYLVTLRRAIKRGSYRALGFLVIPGVSLGTLLLLSDLRMHIQRLNPGIVRDAHPGILEFVGLLIRFGGGVRGQVLSGLAVAVLGFGIAGTTWSMKVLRAREGVSSAYLRVESLLVLLFAVAGIATWIGLVESASAYESNGLWWATSSLAGLLAVVSVGTSAGEVGALRRSRRSVP